MRKRKSTSLSTTFRLENNRGIQDSVAITARALEALARLAEASARIRLSETATSRMLSELSG